MNKFIFILTLIFCFSNSYSYSQNVLRGRIVDQDEIPIANAQITEGNFRNTTFSNFEGEFTLKFFSNDNLILYTAQGFDSLRMSIGETNDIVVFLNRNDSVNPYNLAGYAGFTDFLVKNPNKNLETMPYFLGESDINRQLQMLPGVEQGNEGYSNLFVRGGDVDQNLMLYNGTPIYNFNHLFGISSTFHNRSISNTKLYKGITNAKYGGRTSSVISLESAKNANFSKLEGELEISPLNAGLYIENIVKDKSYFTISARRSWVDLLFPTESRQNDFNFNFYDLQINLGKKLKKNDRIDISFLNTRDLYFFAFNDFDSINFQNTNYGLTQTWGNLVGSVKYSKQMQENLSYSNSLHYSGYRSKTSFSEQIITRSFITPNSEDVLDRGIRDIMAISDWNYIYNNQSKINFGVQAIARFFLTGRERFTATNYPGIDDINEVLGEKNYVPSYEVSIYGENHYQKTKNFSADFGLRTTVYSYKDFQTVVAEPRININFYMTKNDVVKFAYNRHNQFVNQLNLGTIGSPDNIWVPATALLAPQISNVLEGSYERGLGKDYSGTISVFFKDLANLSQVSNFDDVSNPENNWELFVFQGSGSVYGLELMLQKNTGVFSGWIGYTYGKSTRSFEALQDEPYLFSYDRTHMMKIYVNLTSTDEWNFGLNYVLGSGQLFSLPIGKFKDIDGNDQLQYNELNNYRSPAYQRLDLSLVRNKQVFGPEQQWKFYLYNVLGTRNPLNINPTFPDGGVTKLVVERSYLAFVPGIAYVVKF